MIIETGAIFGAGVANFAMHRWILESDNPLVQAATLPVTRALGRQATYVLEFALLIGALWLAQERGIVALTLYGIYTALNAATVAWIKGAGDS